VILLRHARVTLALHAFAAGEGAPLLLLHGLGGSAKDWRSAPIDWPGAVYALDFSGHGESAWVLGGAYTPELLVGDADAALAHLGTAHIAGAGLGAWVALLLAGTRPERVPGALLLPGAGLAGGGALPDFESAGEGWILESSRAPRGDGPHDPLARSLDHDLRPIDYAEAFAVRARRLLLAEGGDARPPWWEAVAKTATAERLSSSEIRSGLQHLARG